MVQKIESGLYRVEPITIDEDFMPKTWIEAQAEQRGLQWVLAHADDGVIWGKFDEEGTLQTSGEVFPEKLPPLRLETLQQCRVFGDKSEVLLWRDGMDGTQWHARAIEDGKGDAIEYFDETQILWGTQLEETRDGFTMAREDRGVRHAVPLIVKETEFKTKERPLRLLVRHYVTYDSDGVARVGLSRLVNLDVEGGK